MKTLQDASTRSELIGRISLLNENSKAQWGKMNVCQMVQHCILSDEMYIGMKTYKRIFLGKLIGQMVLKKLLKDERPLTQNARTLAGFLPTAVGHLSEEKEKWISLIREYDHLPDTGIIHWFFGRMTAEEVGCFAYKHTDHHLRQFGC